MKQPKLTQDEIVYLGNFLLTNAAPGFVPPRNLSARRRQRARDGLVRKGIIESNPKGRAGASVPELLTRDGADIALRALLLTMDDLDWRR